jgi:type IV secretory pathway VirB10-like protein
MSTGVIIAIVVAALIVLALVVLLSRKGRERKLEANRQEARELRRGAEADRATADKTQAEADIKAAEARRHDAEARESAADAEEQQREARERHLEAARLDPDVDESEAAEQYDQEQGRKHGITSHGYESDAPSGDRDHDGVADRGDERVEHYERTATADAERERVYEQDDSGDVVRDEESRRPRT